MKYILFIILMVALYLGLDWIFTCGIIKLICLCFSLKFTWHVATGIWLLTLITKGFFQTILHRIGD